jgi:hypothetical protein
MVDRNVAAARNYDFALRSCRLPAVPYGLDPGMARESGILNDNPSTQVQRDSIASDQKVPNLDILAGAGATSAQLLRICFFSHSGWLSHQTNKAPAVGVDPGIPSSDESECAM